MKTWVVAADSSRARILESDSRTGPLREIEAMVRPEARLHVTDLVSDGPGQSFDSGGQGRHGMPPRHDAKQQEAIRFAKQVGERLSSSHNRGAFEKLYIVAAPSFLGLLRDTLHAPIQATIAGEVSKNLSNHSVDEIRGHLPDFL